MSGERTASRSGCRLRCRLRCRAGCPTVSAYRAEGRQPRVETWDAIRARRNVRVYEDRAIPPADLDQILEAGRRSPSASNWQPWDFVAVTDRDQPTELARVWQGAGHVARSAATIALVAPVPA